MLKNKKALVMSVLCAVASVGFVMSASAAEQTMHGNLDEVVVEGSRNLTPDGKIDKTIHFGIYGDKKFTEVPANITSYTDKMIEQNYMPTRTLFNVATNNPSVMVGGCSTNNNVELQMRGIPFNTHDMLLDGMPGMMGMGIIPENWVGRLDVITGPNIVLSGAGAKQSTSGIINYVPKKAEDKPNLSIKETYSSSHLFTHDIDWGQRFGKDNRYGIRINAERYAGDTSVSNENVQGKDLYINIDQRTKNSKTSLLYGYDHVKHHGMPEVLKISDSVMSTLSGLPSADKVVDNFMPSWSYLSHQRHLYTLSHEQKLNDNVAFYVKGGYQKLTWPGYLDSKPSLLNDAGDYELTISGSQTGSWWQRRVWMSGFKFNFDTGDVKHDVTLGYEYFSHSWYGVTDTGTKSTVHGNIYTGITSDPGAPYAPLDHYARSSSIFNRSVVLADTLSMLDDKLIVTAGLRHQKIHTSSYSSSTGAITKDYNKSATSPTFGAVYKLSPVTSLYANYSEGMSTLSVPKGVVNEKEVLPPVKTKQYEIGSKWDLGDWGTTLSLFKIKQPVGLTDASNHFAADGETRNQGVEWNIFGKVAPKLSMNGGIMLLDAKYKSTQNGAKDGNRVFGTPKINATMAMNWETPVEGLSLNARALYFGSSYADSKNNIKVPSWTRIDLGAKYDTKIMYNPVTFSLMAYNLTDKKYWSTMTTSYGENALMLNPGRTYILSATWHI